MSKKLKYIWILIISSILATFWIIQLSLKKPQEGFLYYIGKFLYATFFLFIIFSLRSIKFIQRKRNV